MFRQTVFTLSLIRNRVTRVSGISSNISQCLLPKNIHFNCCNFQVLVRNQSTGTTHFGSESELGETSSGILEHFPGIPEPPPIPAESIKEVLVELAANGEPTLQSYGLAGYGPAGIIQHLFQFLHIDFGLPWWTAVATATIIIRLALFPVVLKSQRDSYELQEFQKSCAETLAKFHEAEKSGNALLAQEYSAEIQHTMQHFPLTCFVGPLCMGAVFTSFFFACRSMARVPVESLKTGGAYWFTDLTVADPTYILPLICSTSLFFMLKTGADIPQFVGGNKQYIHYFIMCVPVIVFAATQSFPTILLCYWTTNNIISLIQVRCLNNPAVRSYFKLPKLGN